MGGYQVSLYVFSDCEESIVGKKSMELVMFDILKESVSVHQPLPRIIAGEHNYVLTRNSSKLLIAYELCM